MSLNLIELIQQHLGQSEISQAATNLGESESGISKAISALLPTVVGAFANNADKPGILDSILSSGSMSPNADMGNSTQTGSVLTLLSAMFGDKISEINNLVSNYAGVSNASSNSLLNMVTGTAVTALGKHAADHNMGTSELSSELANQKGLVSSLMPAGLSLASLGLGNWGTADEDVNVPLGGTTVAPVIETTATPLPESVKVTSYEDPKIDVTRAGSTHVNVESTEDAGGGSIWKWLLPLILLLAAGFFIWKQCNNNPATGAGTGTDSTMVNSDSMNTTSMTDSANMNSNMEATAKVDKDIDLKGVMIKGYPNGMEESMITFLNTDGYKNATSDDVLKSKWYNFDKVNFEMGSSTQLLAGSEAQMANLVAILKAYPEAKIKVGGYTDKVGDEAINKKISKDRAEYIKTWLASKGVGSQVIDAEGYGSEQATVAATATDAERAVDRRMAIRFTK